jgi:hypothetical protein
MLNPTCTWEVDLQELEQGMRPAGDDPAALERVMALYRGEPLIEDRYEEWAAPIRASIERSWRSLGLRLADAHHKQGSPEAALAWLECVLERDPMDEETVRRLLTVLGELGRRSDALRRFQVFQESLKNELDITPGAETLALVERLRATGNQQPSQVPVNATTPRPHPRHRILSPPLRGAAEARPHTPDATGKPASEAPPAEPDARPSPGSATGTPRVAEAQSFANTWRSALVRHKKALAPAAVALIAVVALAVIVVPRLAGTGRATAPPIGIKFRRHGVGPG